MPNLFRRFHWEIFAILLLGLSVVCIGSVQAADVTARTLSKSVTVTPTITAGAYSANDAVGGLMTFSGVVGTKKTGVLSTVKVVDDGDQGAALVIACADASFTSPGDNNANSLSDADGAKIVAQVSITGSDYIDHGGVKVAVVGGINQLVTSTDSSLYCQASTSGTPTYAATDDLHITLSVLQD